MKDKIINYIKSNKLYIITMIIGSLALMIQMKFVVLYADDLLLGVVSKQGGLKGAIDYLIKNYMTWGGGPTPFIAIIFLMFRMGIWKIFNCAMIIITIILTVRMITYKNNINKGIVSMCLWILIYIVNIFIARETLYWLDGNLAYVLTAFQMFIYFYYLYSRIIMKTEPKKYDNVILPIFAFFAGWSGPQAGAITIIVPIILFIWAKFINKEKIKPIYIISLVVAIVGFLIYYLAPGNNGRSIREFPEFTNYNIIEKVLYRATDIWNIIFNFKVYFFGSISFYLYIALGIMSIIAIKKSKEETNSKITLLIKTISMSIIVFLVLNLAVSINADIFSIVNEKLLTFQPLLQNINNGTFTIKMLVPYMITGIVLIIGIILSYYISYKEKSPLLFIMFLCSILGQIMMLMSPYSPMRSTFITIMLLWISIAYLIAMTLKEKVSIIGIVCLITAMIYDMKIIFAFLFLYFILKNNEEEVTKRDNKKEMLLIGILFILISTKVYLQTLKEYIKNYEVYYENLERIEVFKENSPEDKILYLKEAINPIYGFDGFVGTKWIEDSVKEYFELDEDVVLKYEDGGTNK